MTDHLTSFTTASLLALVLEILFCLLLPFVLVICWHRKSGAGYKTAIMGASMFILFALILEQLSHTLVLVLDSPVKTFVLGHPAAYALYGCLAAGIFEETGRLAGFWLLKKDAAPRQAVAYGLGHGGVEMLLLVGVAMAANLAMGLVASRVGSTVLFPDASAEEVEAVAASLDAVFGMNFRTAALTVLERCSALVLHVSLSVLVYTALHQKGKGFWYPLAILLHAVFDLPAVLYQMGVLQSMVLTEGILLAAAAAVAVLAWKVYRSISPADAVSAKPSRA